MSALGVLRIGNNGYTMFWCPGCDEPHAISTAPGRWTWNGDGDRPTFAPSVLVSGREGPKCHSFVRDGNIEFLPDCKHALAGVTVPLGAWPSEFDVEDSEAEK